MNELKNSIIEYMYPSKGQFQMGEAISIVVVLEDEVVLANKSREETELLSVKLCITHFEKVIYERTITLDSTLKQQEITIPPMEIGGYGVEIQCFEQSLLTAFDVASDPRKIPRYGFLSDFGISEEGDEEDIISMTRLHINFVQFYDWMYRHEDLVSKTPVYRDLMGKEMSLKTVKQKIDLCHERGMEAMAYGAIYAASKDMYEKHPQWGLYNSANLAVTFINIFYIMDIRAKSGWHQHIINEYKKTVEVLDFDGIHMDTYGFPKTGYDYTGEYVALDKEFPILIDHTKEALQTVKEKNTVIFNNVGNWPVYATAAAKQDILYVEVWEPYVTYEHIQRIILEAKAIQDKPMIISAYLKPFMNSGQKEATYALKLMTACVIANGATHLIMGENKRVLTQGYYVDHYPIVEEFYEEIRKYYDFFIRYSELFFDKSLRDVSMTCAYGDNREYCFENGRVSPCGEGGKIWTILRENETVRLISLINLIGNNNQWNEAKKEPIKAKDLKISILIEKSMEGVFLMSPENPAMVEVPYEITESERGKVLNIQVKEVSVWSVLVVKK